MIASTPYPSINAITNVGPLINRHIEHAFRRIMTGPGVDMHPRFVRLETGEPHPFGNFACMSESAEAADAQVAIEPLVRRGAPSAVFFTGPVTIPIAEQLQHAGFERHGGLPAMAVEFDQLARTALPGGYTLARVWRIADRDAWADVFARGYGLPRVVGAAFAGGINDDDSSSAPVQYFWILVAGKPVATSLMVLHEGVAGIYGVATLPEERGKGLGAHVTAEPLRLAQALGYRVGVLQSSEDGHPVYRRIGFTDFGEVPLYLRMPTEMGAD